MEDSTPKESIKNPEDIEPLEFIESSFKIEIISSSIEP